MYLVDSNVWLELLLEQDQAGSARAFFEHTPSHQLFLTDFAFHSVGVVLARLGNAEAFLTFAHDTLSDGRVGRGSGSGLGVSR
ncbi:MAG: hypothetical protein HW416_2104 [Chloroflexi bacterium]|nr:hypothetical protein [Chloroflexota bacterium]